VSPRNKTEQETVRTEEGDFVGDPKPEATHRRTGERRAGYGTVFKMEPRAASLHAEADQDIMTEAMRIGTLISERTTSL